MPKIAEIEYTPNPNAVKFVLKEPVTAGFPKAFRDQEMAEHDGLAKGLFAVEHVISVFMQDKFITVTKDDSVGWTELLPKLAPPIRQAPSVSGQAAEAPHWDRPEADLNDPVLQSVRKVLNASILPVADTGTAVAGTASTPIANVAANDSVNGAAATLGGAGNATVAQSGAWPAGIARGTLVRFAVGFEAPEDLQADITQALRVLASP